MAANGQWNSRYVNYSRVHGRGPDEMLDYDTVRFPGGKMCGFILWIGERWVEWKKNHPELRPSHGHDWLIRDEDLADFDLWLGTLPLRTEGGS